MKSSHILDEWPTPPSTYLDGPDLCVTFTGAGQPWRVRSSLWVRPLPVLQFHGHRGNWGGLVMSICNFVGSALFILSVSILKVAHTFPGTSIK